MMDGNYQNSAGKLQIAELINFYFVDTLSEAKHYVKKASKTIQDSLTTGN